ncbi:hypothetical protein DFH28DRAFT_942151, partial [Melampsora americana]
MVRFRIRSKIGSKHIHHTEIYLPNHQSDSSIAYLIGIIQSTIINNHLSNSIHPHHHQHQHQLNPSTLLISLSSVRLNKLDESIKRLTKDIQEICLYELKDSKPLSDQLNEIESQPIWNSNLFLISNLNRVLLLIEKGYLLINSNLKILTIDLRLEDHQTKINHHLINELISFFKFIQPTTQLIFISSNIDSQQRPPPALSSLINQLINQSIHSNLLNSNLIHLHHGHHSEPLIGSDSNTSFDSQFTHLGSSFDPSHHSISSTHFTIPDVGF